MIENAITYLGFLKAMGIIRSQNNRDQVPAFNYENQHSCNIVMTVKGKVTAEILMHRDLWKELIEERILKPKKEQVI